MSNKAIHVALLAALTLFSDLAMAVGFQLLPTSGGTAYLQCAVSAHDAIFENNWPQGNCVAPNGEKTLLAYASSPEAGFALQSSATSPVFGFGETIATLSEAVFRNSSTNQCIYEKRLAMSSAPIHLLRVNDIAFGGYTGAVSAAYAKTSVSDSSVSRIGRSFTSVQWRTDVAGDPIFPPAGGVLGTEINGAGSGQTTPSNTAQQMAPFSASWVDFSTNPSGTNYGYPPDLNSSNMYIKQACASATTTVVPNSMRLRQTGRYQYEPWVVVTGTSRAPSSNIAP